MVRKIKVWIKRHLYGDLEMFCYRCGGDYRLYSISQTLAEKLEPELHIGTHCFNCFSDMCEEKGLLRTGRVWVHVKPWEGKKPPMFQDKNQPGLPCGD